MYKFEYYLIRFFYIIFSFLPFKLVEYIADFTAFLLKSVFRFRRQVLQANLIRVYGNNLPLKSKELTKKIYRNFVYVWFELLQGKKLNKSNFNQHFTIHNLEVLNNIVLKGRGAIIVTGHLGNFEWLMPFFSLQNYNFKVIMKKLKNPYVNKFIIRLREQFGGQTVVKKKAPREGYKFLQTGGLFAIIGDQDARRKGIFVDFMGLPSSTAIGPASFHLKTKAPLIFIALIRRRYGYFDVFFEEVIIGENLTKSDENLMAVTQAHTKVLEKWILKYPDQWFWIHKRWKTRPKPLSSNF